jgi:regulator of replication initiation timing
VLTLTWAVTTVRPVSGNKQRCNDTNNNKNIGKRVFFCQVQFVEEEKELLKSMTGDVDTLQAEINQLRNKLNLVVEELQVTREDNVTLSRELDQQQVLLVFVAISEVREGQDKSTVQDDNMAFLKRKFDPRTVLHSIAHTVHTHSRAQAVKCFF